ncbi:GSCOCG00007002001-RA-CDS [Cotesia congregata]|nr:GSCOCG00007002001-RA-CDS [Cotesia congregata]
MHRRVIRLSIIIDSRVTMDDNDDFNDVTVPYNSQWHVSLNKLIETLNVTEKGQETVKKIVTEYLPTCPINLLEENILRKTCPYLKRIIYELIDEIEANLEDPEIAGHLVPTSFDSQLIECKNLLTRWEDILKHVANLEEVKPSDVVSLLEHFPGIVIKICLHCKEKRSSYPNHSLPLLLQDIYRDTCSNVKIFCGFIYKSLYIQSEDSTLLKNLIKDLGDIASTTTYFVTTMIQSWKTFGKLVWESSAIIKDDGEIRGLVTSNFKNITSNIIWIYENMTKTSEDDSKGAKCMNLLLEILYKFHRNYVNDDVLNSSLNHQWVREMVSFLFRLSGFYATKMFVKNLPGKPQSKSIFSLNWINAFNYYYKNCETLHEEFKNREEEMASADFEYLVGYHVTLLRSNLDADEKIKIAINNLIYFNEECMTTRVKIPDGCNINNVEPELISIYHFTLKKLCCCIVEAKFKDLELFIFKILFSEKFWPSLLCFDILKYLYRYSEGEFALSHIKILSEVYEKFHLRESTSLGVTLISKLIIYGYTFMGDDNQNTFHEICQSPATLLLILKSPKIVNSREKLLTAYKKLMPVKSFDLSQAHQELRLQPSVKNWINFVNVLTLKSIDKIDDNPDITSDLQKILQSILDTLNQVHDEFQQRIMYDLILIILNCTIFKRSTDMSAFNWNVLQVLAKEIVHTIKLPEIYLVDVCHFIKRNSKILKIPSGQVDARVVMINLMCYLLSSSLAIVHQEALETFEYIVEKGADEDFILKLGATITKKYNLLEVVPNYLKKRSVKKLSREFTDINDYLKIFTENVDKLSSAHKCFIEETREREKKIAKIIPDSVDQQASKIIDDLIDVIDNKYNLSVNILEKLTEACLKFIDK